MKNNLRSEVLQVRATKSMRELVEKRAMALDLSISSYLELVIGKHLSEESKHLHNEVEIC